MGTFGGGGTEACGGAWGTTAAAVSTGVVTGVGSVIGTAGSCWSILICILQCVFHFAQIGDAVSQILSGLSDFRHDVGKFLINAIVVIAIR